MWRGRRRNSEQLLEDRCCGYWAPTAPTPWPPAIASPTGGGRRADTAGPSASYRQLLADRERVLGPDHPDTLSARASLAYWRGEAGDTDGAVSHYRQLLADRERVLGPDHPDTLSARTSLAYWRGEAGDTDGAVADYRQLLADRERVLGPDHPDTLATRQGLADWLGGGRGYGRGRR